LGANPALIGRAFALPQPYRVGEEDLKAFARAVGAANPAALDRDAANRLGYPGIVAVPTFAVKIAQLAEAAYVRQPVAGIDFSRVVHAHERLVHHRPLVAGDVLDAVTHVEDVATRSGLTLVTTRTEITAHGKTEPADDAANQLGPERVATVWSTLAVREPA
jgi:acyl dehydratase